jgi:hypothetical protein
MKGPRVGTMKCKCKRKYTRPARRLCIKSPKSTKMYNILVRYFGDIAGYRTAKNDV